MKVNKNSGSFMTFLQKNEFFVKKCLGIIFSVTVKFVTEYGWEYSRDTDEAQIINDNRSACKFSLI